LGWLGVSPIGAAALPQIVQGFVGQRIETTRGDIFLNLAVPCGSVQLGDPRPKCGEFLRGKPANGILDLFNRAHATKLTSPGRSAQPPVVTHFGFVAPGFSPAQPQNADPALRGRRYAKLRHYPTAGSV